MGVQVPPLAPSFRRWAWLGLVALVSCVQTPEDFSRAVQVGWQRAAGHPTPEVLGLLTPASRDLVQGIDRRGQWPGLRQRVMDALADARVQESSEGTPNRVLRRPDGPALLLVRDGWGWRLDLVLSEGIWPAGGPGEGYSRPW
ncbi:hypothetical protein KBD49_06080 [Myxococcota bacterium]|nr:hypothetical protein [Myxococcota bacterium]